jgi:peptide/nickel transport system ATP-binding protein
MTRSSDPLLSVRDLRVDYSARAGAGSWFASGAGEETVRAVDGVSFELEAGRTLALVGESGCGKTTLARAVLRLVPAAGGQIRFRPDPRAAAVDLLALGPSALRRLRPRLQIVFQDPHASLNPRLEVGRALGEVLHVHRRSLGLSSAAAREERVRSLLESVGLARETATRFPHQLSGGQRQRAAIARSLAPSPSLLVCDEVVSALDVSVQAQVLELLRDLQESHGLAYLFIAHDLAVVRQIAHEVAVMRAGRIVEQGATEELLRAPQHAYTRTLLASAPRISSAPERSRRTRAEPPPAP